MLWWCSLLQSAWSYCSLLSLPRLSAVLWILLQKFSFQTQHILPSEMRHIVVFSITSKCIAAFSEESGMTEVQWNVQWWMLGFSIDSIVVCVFFGRVRSGSKGASLSWRVAEQWHRLPSAVGHTWAALSSCAEMRGCFCPVQSLFQCPSFIPSWCKNPSNSPNSRNKSAARQENSWTNDQH